MNIIKIDVSFEIPEELYCSRSAGQYDNIIECNYCEWDEEAGMNFCNVFHKWLKWTKGEWKDSVPCQQCRDARLKALEAYRRLSWFGKMKHIGSGIGGQIVAILTWKKRSN